MSSIQRATIVTCLIALGFPGVTHGQQETLTTVIDGPPPPVAPATITRDAAGKATVRAVRLNSSVQLDGSLDEDFYETVPPVSNF